MIGRFTEVLTLCLATSVVVAGGTKAKAVGEGAWEAFVVMLVMFRLVIFCSRLERRLKFGEGELELELEVCCFRMELVRETGAEGGREDLERAEEVEGAWETRRDMAGDGGAGRVEEGVSSGLVAPVLVESEK